MSKFDNLAVLNTAQVAEYLGVSMPTIYMYIKKGAIPYFRFGGNGQYRFKKSAIDAVFKQNNKGRN